MRMRKSEYDAYVAKLKQNKENISANSQQNDLHLDNAEENPTQMRCMPLDQPGSSAAAMGMWNEQNQREITGAPALCELQNGPHGNELSPDVCDVDILNFGELSDIFDDFVLNELEGIDPTKWLTDLEIISETFAENEQMQNQNSSSNKKMPCDQNQKPFENIIDDEPYVDVEFVDPNEEMIVDVENDIDECAVGNFVIPSVQDKDVKPVQKYYSIAQFKEKIRTKKDSYVSVIFRNMENRLWYYKSGNRSTPDKKNLYQCMLCTKCVTCFVNLRYHLQRHLDQSSYTCNQCSMNFVSPAIRRKHKRSAPCTTTLG